jgi:uncharacterized phiE125 gp8 family phage protein
MSYRPRHSLTLVTPPASEPVSIGEAKAWARIDGDDDDYQVAQLIATAREAAEQYLRRSLITQTWKLTIDLGGNGLDRLLGEGTYNLPVTALYGDLPRIIELPKAPTQSITSVVTYDLNDTASTFDPANYRLEAAGERLVLNHGCLWPSSMRIAGACEVTYVTGYGDKSSDMPRAILMAIQIHVASLYEQRGQCDDAMDLPPGAKQLLNQYRIMGSRRG